MKVWEGTLVLTKEEHQHYKTRQQILEIQRTFQAKNGTKNLSIGGKAGSTIHKDFFLGEKKSAIETYSTLSTGPYVEPSYNSERIYRDSSKLKWVGEKAWRTHI